MSCAWRARTFDYPEQRIAFEEMMLAIRQAQERLDRLEHAISRAVPDWSLAEVATALMAMRGIDLTRGDDLLAEMRPLAVPNAARADGISLVPSELRPANTSSAAPSPRPATGALAACCVECAWSYQHPPAVGRNKQQKVDAASPAVR